MRYEDLWERVRSLAFTAASRSRTERSAAPAILLLSSQLGCGHERAARAIEAALRRCAPAATGQEGFNVRFLVRHQVGRLVSDQELPDQIDCLLNHPFALAALQDRAWTFGQRDGATHIAKLVLGLISGREEHEVGKTVARGCAPIS